MRWSKRLKTLTEKWEFGPHALSISGRFSKETLGASWHWQVGINPKQVSAINHVRSPQNRRAGSSLASHRAFHSFTQAHRRVSKVQQKMCSLEQRTRAPSILTLSWRILDKPTRWKVVVDSQKDARILGLQRRRNQSRARDKAWLLRALCNKVVLKYKGNRESFWHRHRKEAERIPPC